MACAIATGVGSIERIGRGGFARGALKRPTRTRWRNGAVQCTRSGGGATRPSIFFCACYKKTRCTSATHRLPQTKPALVAQSQHNGPQRSARYRLSRRRLAVRCHADYVCAAARPKGASQRVPPSQLRPGEDRHHPRRNLASVPARPDTLLPRPRRGAGASHARQEKCRSTACQRAVAATQRRQPTAVVQLRAAAVLVRKVFHQAVPTEACTTHFFARLYRAPSPGHFWRMVSCRPSTASSKALLLHEEQLAPVVFLIVFCYANVANLPLHAQFTY